jgi:hypothetical protein
MSAEYDVDVDEGTGRTDGYVRIRLDQTARDRLSNRTDHRSAVVTTLDVQPERPSGTEVYDTQHIDVGQSHQQLTHADRASLLLRAYDLQIPLISEESL